MTEQCDAGALDSMQHVRQQSLSVDSLLRFVLTVLTLPYRRAFELYTWKPLRNIRLAKGDHKLVIPLVKEWKAEKYTELQSVQVAVSPPNLSVVVQWRSAYDLGPDQILGYLLRRCCLLQPSLITIRTCCVAL